MMGSTVRDVMINRSPVAGPQLVLDRICGSALLNDMLLNPHGTLIGPVTPGYIRPWRHIPGLKSGTSKIHINNDGFMVNLDVDQFKPEEVTVKVVDNCVTVEGNHEERLDEHGFVSRQLKRRYVLPEEIEHEAIQSTLSSDGVLTIQAPKKKLALAEQNARVIPIVHTQAPALK